MAQRRFHYEQAFEHYLRANRVPYLAVDEARKTLLPPDRADGEAGALKSFDFVVYGPEHNALVDIKGRMYGTKRARSPESTRRLESWVTRDDVDSLDRWRELFGEAFHALFVFVYCLRQQPPDALFERVFAFGGRWYVLREVDLADYRAHMVVRSQRWGTVHVPGDAFARIARPFSLRGGANPETSCEVTRPFVS